MKPWSLDAWSALGRIKPGAHKDRPRSRSGLRTKVEALWFLPCFFEVRSDRQKSRVYGRTRVGRDRDEAERRFDRKNTSGPRSKTISPMGNAAKLSFLVFWTLIRSAKNEVFVTHARGASTKRTRDHKHPKKNRTDYGPDAMRNAAVAREV